MIQVPQNETPLLPDTPEEKHREDALAANSEYQVAVMIKRLLDHALVKDAVTALHQEHDAHLEKLAEYEGEALQNILKDEEAFLREQERRYSARFADERQRSLFHAMTGEYFAQAMGSAKMLRNRLVLDFQRAVIGKQNQEFIDRALSENNLFDDELQTMYRDLVLCNLENLHADLPDAERQSRLDEACRDYYTRIVEHRLAADPARLDAMLSSSAVRRVLGDDAAREFANKAKTAARDESLSRTAQQWVDDDIPAARARIRIASLPERDRPRARELYRYWRHQDNRRRFLEYIVTMEKAWRIVAEGNYRIAAIPSDIRRGHPELYALFVRALEKRAKNGGQPPASDYAYLADFVYDHQPVRWAETLRDAERACRFIEALGGPDGRAFQMALRFIIGKATEEDGLFFEDLLAARSVYERERAAKDIDCDVRSYFAAFVKARSISLKRENHDELPTEQIRSLALACVKKKEKPVSAEIYGDAAQKEPTEEIK